MSQSCSGGQGGYKIWPIKEWATLIAMLAGLASFLPLGLVLLQTEFFRSVPEPVGAYFSVKSYFKFVAINGILMWLYLMTTPILTWFYQLTGIFTWVH